MIIWHNEATPVSEPPRLEPPWGTVEITRVEERAGQGPLADRLDYHIWFAPVPARQADAEVAATVICQCGISAPHCHCKAYPEPHRHPAGSPDEPPPSVPDLLAPPVTPPRGG